MRLVTTISTLTLLNRKSTLLSIFPLEDFIIFSRDEHPITESNSTIFLFFIASTLSLHFISYLANSFYVISVAGDFYNKFMNYYVRIVFGFDRIANIVYTLLYLLTIHNKLRISFPHIYIRGRFYSFLTAFIVDIFYPSIGWIMFTFILLLLDFFIEYVCISSSLSL